MSDRVVGLGKLLSGVVSILALAGMAGAGEASADPRIPGPSGILVVAVNVSRQEGNQSEAAIAVNPTDPRNVVVVSNDEFGALFEGNSFDGGSTWKRKEIATGADLGRACCDPSLAFDQYGNLFLTYLYAATTPKVPVALSTDGGRRFSIIAQIADPNISRTRSLAARAGGTPLSFLYVDQPTVATGPGSVWVSFNGGGPMYAAGARVTGLGRVQRFLPAQKAPHSWGGSFGDIAVGPRGQVAMAWQRPTNGQHAGVIALSLDPDGPGPRPFNDRPTVATTPNVGGFDYLPAQPDRSVDAEAGLAYDRSGGPHTGRLLLVYTDELIDESNDFNVELRHSDDDGATWSEPARVNDDLGVTSQFLPRISLDQTTGNIAMSWHDCRQDHGDRESGDTDGKPNDDAEFYATFSKDGGRSFKPNIRVGAGASNALDAGNGIDYGDYTGLSFWAGVARPAWADNSNTSGDNPDGSLHAFDIYSAAVPVP
jgi:hypothetical protein